MIKPALVLGALLLAATVSGACGSDGGGADATIVIPEACKPATQTGCAADQKCTWIRTAATAASQIGKLGCVPATGAKKVDEQCSYGPAGDTTGYDDCAPGLICMANPDEDMAAGRCREVCDEGAAAGSPAACDANWACGSYVSFFQNAGDDDAKAGVCDPSCDPLTQRRKTDNVAACGSANPDKPNLACYGNVPTTENPVPPKFTCAVIGGAAGHRDDARDMTTGKVYRNGCAPGNIVGFLDTNVPNAPQKPVCLKLCKPGETYMGHADAVHGVGDAASQCVGDKFTGDDECRYWWFFDGNDTLNDFSNNLGICWRFSSYMYPSKGAGTTADTVWPSCTTLANTDDPGTEIEDRPGTPNTTPEHLEWGCGPAPTASMLRSASTASRPRIIIPESSRAEARRYLLTSQPVH